MLLPQAPDNDDCDAWQKTILSSTMNIAPIEIMELIPLDDFVQQVAYLLRGTVNPEKISALSQAISEACARNSLCTPEFPPNVDESPFSGISFSYVTVDAMVYSDSKSRLVAIVENVGDISLGSTYVFPPTSAKKYSVMSVSTQESTIFSFQTTSSLLAPPCSHRRFGITHGVALKLVFSTLCVRRDTRLLDLCTHQKVWWTSKSLHA